MTPPPKLRHSGTSIVPDSRKVTGHAAVATLAVRQHGLFTLDDALKTGLTRRQVGYGVESNRYVRVGPRLYRIVGVPSSWEQQLLAAVLTCETGTLASHRSAACLWGLDGSRPGAVEISVPRNHRPRYRENGRVHESTDLELAEPTVIKGIPVTGLVRTLIDLAAVVSRRRLTQAVDDAIRRRKTTWEQLAAVRARHSRRGRDGVGKMRELLEERYGTTIPDSYFGRLVADLLVDAGLPQPEIEHNVYSETGEWLARVDVAYPRWKIAIELDSKQHHLHEEAFEADRPRQNRLEIEGWLVLRYTWLFYSRHPNKLCAEVREAVRHRRGP
jgi:hypothetical protein